MRYSEIREVNLGKLLSIKGLQDAKMKRLGKRIPLKEAVHHPKKTLYYLQVVCPLMYVPGP
jgi:hypothetical protein